MAQKPVSTSQGEVKLPIFYYDVSAVLIFFWTDFQKAAVQLKGTGLQACRFFNGSALTGLAFYEYRDSDIGPYNEVGLATAVYSEQGAQPTWYLPDFLRPAKKRKLGFYIHHLPVSTEAACAAGKEIWGFPKFTTQLPFSLNRNHFEAAVLDPDGGNILSVKGPLNLSVPLPGFDLLLFSNHKNRQLRTIVDVKAIFKTTIATNLHLNIGESPHPMTRTLFDLGLNGVRPFVIQTTNKFISRLNGGTPVE
jgi:hypothetical protein